MKVLVGLGNPGSRYEKTRHNVGFMVIDLLGTEFGDNFQVSSQFKGSFCKTKFKNEDLVLLKPLTFMNLSGESVAQVVRWYKVELENVLVIHDDVSLPLGKIRVQRKGGAGGQHGIESIMNCLGDDGFDRIKVGVGPDPGGDRRADYVLSEVPETDKDLFFESLSMAAKATRTWLTSGAEVSANRFNGRNLVKDKQEKADKANKNERGPDTESQKCTSLDVRPIEPNAS